MFWLCFVSIFIHIFEVTFADDLLTCYSPAKIAHLVKEPLGGVNDILNPIIFLHAADCSKEYWFEIPQAVADRTGRRVFVLDARNHGDSEWSDCFNFDVNAEDLVRFMDEQSIQVSILVGHGMGGVTAIKVSLLYPGRVEKVIVEDFSVTTVSAQAVHNIAKYVLLVEEAAENVPHDFDFDQATQYVLDYVNEEHAVVAASSGVSTIPVNTTRYFPLKQAANGGYTMKVNNPVVVYNLRSPETTMSENTGVYQGPAFFIYGTESPLHVISDAVNIINHFPYVQFFPVFGSNHEIHSNLPYAFTEYILQFIFQ